MIDSRYFVDVFGEVVSAVRSEYDTVNDPVETPYYIYGHPIEIANRLSLKDQSAVDKFKKFPLICLLTDLTLSKGQQQNIAYSVDPFTVLIVTNTNKDYTSEERTENTFKPILYPIYYLLINKILSSIHIKKNFDLIDHDHIDRYFWGSGTINGNTSLVFNEYLDAIELRFNNIQVFKSTSCQ